MPSFYLHDMTQYILHHLEQFHLFSVPHIKKTADSFETPFFDTLRLYLKDSNKGAGIVQSVTDMPLLDAQSMHAELT